MREETMTAQIGQFLKAGVLLLALGSVASCSRETPEGCKDPGTLKEKYFGFDDSGLNQYVELCFGPSANCQYLCSSLAESESRSSTMAFADVCERVPSPDGWADAGYQGWEDAGYVRRVVGDAGVDPNRILHVVFRIRPFCGT
jgi:hypothetical protein